MIISTAKEKNNQQKSLNDLFFYLKYNLSTFFSTSIVFQIFSINVYFFLNFSKKKILKKYNKKLNILTMIDNRPLSPHLSVHKQVLTSVFSIFHRITGIGLSIGSIAISIWVSLIALGPNFFFIFELLSSSLVFKLVLFLWTLGIFYHLFNGVRYLFWTYGLGMDLKTVYNSGYLILFLTIGTTCFVWLI